MNSTLAIPLVSMVSGYHKFIVQTTKRSIYSTQVINFCLVLQDIPEKILKYNN